MDGGHETNRAYYDEFSKQYEAHRGDNAPRGYHNLLDSLESEYVRRFGEGREVLEVGCGTGLVLERIDSARADGQLHAGPGKLGGDRRADALGGAGDQGVTPSETQVERFADRVQHR